MTIVSGGLGLLFAIVVVLMAGQMSGLQDTGSAFGGSIGTFFGSLMTLWVLLGGLVAVLGFLLFLWKMMK